MKPILDIQKEKLFEIKDDEQIELLEGCLNSLYNYYQSYKLLGDRIIRLSVGSNKDYINAFFWVVDYLYQYYEFSQRHFELLNLAATNLERLSQEKIAALSIDEEKEASRSELGDYLDKVTLIFQTAADKTKDTERALFYAATAEDYSKRADTARGVVVALNHNEKIVALYEKAARENARFFLGEIFRNRAAEYREKCEAKEMPEARTASFSSSGEVEIAEEVSETSPLLGSHRESADGLRRRTAHLDEERPTSTPSPS